MSKDAGALFVTMVLSLTCLAQSSKNFAPDPSPTPSPTAKSSKPSDGQVPKKFPDPSGYPNPAGGMEILSDTMGVDFRPYMIVLKEKVNKRWVEIMPESALPPELKSGVVAVKFAIIHNGRVMGLTVEESSGDKALDHAAFAALADSSPLPALPESFIGDYLMIRARFYYNPAKQHKTQSDNPPAQSPTPKSSQEKK